MSIPEWVEARVIVQDYRTGATYVYEGGDCTLERWRDRQQMNEFIANNALAGLRSAHNIPMHVKVTLHNIRGTRIAEPEEGGLSQEALDEVIIQHLQTRTEEETEEEMRRPKKFKITELDPQLHKVVQGMALELGYKWAAYGPSVSEQYAREDTQILFNPEERLMQRNSAWQDNFPEASSLDELWEWLHEEDPISFEVGCHRVIVKPPDGEVHVFDGDGECLYTIRPSQAILVARAVRTVRGEKTHEDLRKILQDVHDVVHNANRLRTYQDRIMKVREILENFKRGGEDE